jgi:hypothetical protein
MLCILFYTFLLLHQCAFTSFTLSTLYTFPAGRAAGVSLKHQKRRYPATAVEGENALTVFLTLNTILLRLVAVIIPEYEKEP